jgi:hypothetical protein
MAERSVALALSGEEIIEAVVARIRKEMRTDCFLNKDLAYSYFEAEVHYKIRLQDCGRAPEAKGVARAKGGEVPTTTENEEDLFLKEGDIEMQMAPPNEVRQESDQPLPVLGTGENGKPEIRRVTYAKPGTFQSGTE